MNNQNNFNLLQEIINFFTPLPLKIEKNIIAIACFNNDSTSKFQISGTVKFTEEKYKVKIEINLTGLTPNHKHGFHVHESGDLTQKCKSMCAHFNPLNKNHGCPGKQDRHVGDLGNLYTDENGNANYIMYDDVIRLSDFKLSIIGRGLIIHKDIDDCGEYQGDDQDKIKASLANGNAGERIACAIIGYSKDNFICN
jgi:Cu-Zn family superoxide dismutase